MKKQRKKINFKLIIYILLLAIITAIIISGTFARYTSKGDQEEIGYVAKWSFNVNGLGNESLTRANIKEGTILGDKIAPGTAGYFTVGIDATGCEVAVEYKVKISSVENKPNNLYFYTINQNEEKVKVTNYEEYEIKGLIYANEENKVKTEKIYWKWEYETEGENADKDDTDDGKNIEHMAVSISAVGIQYLPQKYGITYDLDGGKLGEGSPTEYEVALGGVLIDPTRLGYTFAGWTGSNGEEPQKEVKIEKNSREEKTYTANWTPITYTISYTLNGGIVTGNPAEYTIESNDITLNNPTKTGYTFKGWTENSETEKELAVNIEHGSVGDRTYTANWEANTYSVTLNTNGGTINSGNVQSYTYGVGATLPTNITKGSFTFLGWYENANCTGSAITTITTTDIGNKTYWAKWDGHILNGSNLYTNITNGYILNHKISNVWDNGNGVRSSYYAMTASNKGNYACLNTANMINLTNVSEIEMTFETYTNLTQLTSIVYLVVSKTSGANYNVNANMDSINLGTDRNSQIGVTSQAVNSPISKTLKLNVADLSGNYYIKAIVLHGNESDDYTSCMNVCSIKLKE